MLFLSQYNSATGYRLRAVVLQIIINTIVESNCRHSKSVYTPVLHSEVIYVFYYFFFLCVGAYWVSYIIRLRGFKPRWSDDDEVKRDSYYRESLYYTVVVRTIRQLLVKLHELTNLFTLRRLMYVFNIFQILLFIIWKLTNLYEFQRSDSRN